MLLKNNKSKSSSCNNFFSDSSISRQNNQLSEIFEAEVEERNKGKFKRIWDYINHSSLFLFKKEWRLRQTLLVLVSTQDDIVITEKAKEMPEKYGIDDLEKSQRFQHISINSGKIIAPKRMKVMAK